MKKVNCFRCKHFRTTWNPAFPRACEAYGFKTKEMPSAYVLKSTGTECLQFAEKNQKKMNNQAGNPSVIDYRL
ncbi:uracil-DNA glycosylase [Halobacillus litoralis]|uniref:Uracil-DNA glycosylase n=1 Tax=Halobacillus litoralis TaxID=45668 RepID=A0A845E2T0_9BACI|nr:uracil-DNA glycosylase [Halobacillus litoralis]MYL49560.1 uracil-DNA glycosylase [Halobacillus litoralis]